MPLHRLYFSPVQSPARSPASVSWIRSAEPLVADAGEAWARVSLPRALNIADVVMGDICGGKLFNDNDFPHNQ